MDPGAIRDQIERILHSRSFATKGQLRKLLEVLHKNVDSQASLTTELVIRELWPTETKTKHAKDVATEMNRLRRAVESYYDGEGEADPVIIYFPNRASTGDGHPETRWLDAMQRNGTEAHTPVPLPSRSTAQAPKSHPSARVEGRWGWKRAAVIMALCGVGIVGYFSTRLLSVPDQPRFGRLDGSMLIVMNADGKELWRKAFPGGFSTDPYYYAQGPATRFWFGDLEGRGRTSVLFLYLPGDSPQTHSSTLICYSEKGKEKWRWTPGRELPELHGTPATYWTVALRVLKPVNGKPARIVTSSRHEPWWPNQIAILNSDGKILSEYWHSGHFGYVTLADLDGDGREEIIATGISNGYRQATLVVLDPDRVFGASTEAARPELQIHGMGAAQERLRLLFPRSDMNKELSAYNDAAEAAVQNSIVRLPVLECLSSPSCAIWYEFDKNFHLMTAYADDFFRGAHAQFYRNRKDAHSFTAEEQATFQKVRCLVGCKSEFVPVGNLVP